MIKKITILLEEDYASNNFCAYVPSYRINALGDTEEEALKCAAELILLQLEADKVPVIYSSKVVSIQVEVPDTFTDREKIASSI